MIENGPYIIVDNRRIAPIAPSSQTRPAGGDQKDPRDPPFGIVDRVTISDAARERFRRYNAGNGTPMTTSADRRFPGQRPHQAPLLIYEPRQR